MAKFVEIREKEIQAVQNITSQNPVVMIIGAADKGPLSLTLVTSVNQLYALYVENSPTDAVRKAEALIASGAKILFKRVVASALFEAPQ